MPRLFALDHNFPQPIVSALADFQVEAKLVRIDAIDRRMADLDDWELLLALHNDEQPWDGMITTDSSMLNQPRELAALMQTKLTLVVADASGHDPLKASGLLFAYLAGICKRTDSETAQIWKLNAAERPALDPWGEFKRVAAHQHRNAQDLWAESQIDAATLARNPLTQA